MSDVAKVMFAVALVIYAPVLILPVVIVWVIIQLDSTRRS